MGGKRSNIKQKQIPTEIWSENVKVKVDFIELEVDDSVADHFSIVVC